MAEHDYSIANDTGANVRTDINNVLSAIVSNNSNGTEPTTKFAFMWWADTGNDLLKQRNAANNAWINILTLSTGAVTLDSNILKANVADVLTAGFAVTDYDAGTKTTGTYTPDEANGNVQKFVNGGAFTLAPPTNSCTLVLQQTNNASAGTITTSGFTLVDGDSLTTTNGDDFLLYITKVSTFSLLTVKALQ